LNTGRGDPEMGWLFWDDDTYTELCDEMAKIVATEILVTVVT
jgi:hypothetical protein